MFNNIRKSFLYNDEKKLLPIQLIKTSYGVVDANPDLSMISNVDTSQLSINVGTSYSIGYLINIEEDEIVEAMQAGESETIRFSGLKNGSSYHVYVVSKSYADGYLTSTGVVADATPKDRRVFTFNSNGESVSVNLEPDADDKDPQEWYDYSDSYEGPLTFYSEPQEMPDYSSDFNNLNDSINRVDTSVALSEAHVIEAINSIQCGVDPNLGTDPMANFSYHVDTNNPLKVIFTNLSVNAVSYSWSFGNGVTSTAENPSVTYADEGTYVVTLNVTSLNGATDSFQQSITINDALPTAGWSYSADVNNPLEITFTNFSTNATSYYWNFGNGITSTAENPSVTYNEAGSYAVRLTSFNANMKSVYYEENIVVYALPGSGEIEVVLSTDRTIADDDVDVMFSVVATGDANILASVDGWKIHTGLPNDVVDMPLNGYGQQLNKLKNYGGAAPDNYVAWAELTVGSTSYRSVNDVTMTITNEIPIVNFTSDHDDATYGIYVVINEQVLFTNISTMTSDVKGWSMEFGDGSVSEMQTGMLARFAHTYTETTGTRRPKLIAHMESGQVYEFDRVLRVHPDWVTDPSFDSVYNIDTNIVYNAVGSNSYITSYPLNIRFECPMLDGMQYKFEIHDPEEVNPSFVRYYSTNNTFEWHLAGTDEIDFGGNASVTYHVRVSYKRSRDGAVNSLDNLRHFTIFKEEQGVSPDSFYPVLMHKYKRKVTSPSDCSGGDCGQTWVYVDHDESLDSLLVPGIEFTKDSSHDSYQWAMKKFSNPNGVSFNEYPDTDGMGLVKFVRIAYGFVPDWRTSVHTFFRYVPYDVVDDMVNGTITINMDDGNSRIFTVHLDDAIDAEPYYAYQSITIEPGMSQSDNKAMYFMWRHQPDTYWQLNGGAFDYAEIMEQGMTNQSLITTWWAINDTSKTGQLKDYWKEPFYPISTLLVGGKALTTTDKNINGNIIDEITINDVQQSGQLAIMMNVRYLKKLLKSVDDNMWATVNNTNRVIMNAIIDIKNNISRKTSTIFNITNANVSTSDINVRYKNMDVNGEWKSMSASVDDDGDVAMIDLSTIDDFGDVGNYLLKINPTKLVVTVDRIDNDIVYIKDDLNGYATNNHFFGWNVQFMDDSFTKIGGPKLVAGSYYNNSEQRLQITPSIRGMVNGGSKIQLWSNLFVPVMVEVDIVSQNETTISYALYGKKEMNTNTGLCTIYDYNGNIYKQFSYGKILDQGTEFDLIEYRDPV